MASKPVVIRIVGDAKGLDRAVEEADQSFGRLRDGMDRVVKAAAVAGAAIGAALTQGILDSLEVGKANDKLAAQLGLPPEMAADMGRVAGKLYAQAYGESIGDVNAALRSVLSSGMLPEDATDAQIEALTAKAIDLASAFDADVGQASRAAGQMIRTGLAKDADEAFDILTRGFQQTGDLAGDLLDTYSEYSTQFRKLGLSGQQATGLLAQGVRAGARDLDTVADALKEFSIRSIDGSKASATAWEALGKNADTMARRVGAGGDDAREALQETLASLREIEDPVARSAIAVGLFGTKAEDLGDALGALDVDDAVKALGTVEGAATQLGDTLNDNAATKIEAFKRRVKASLGAMWNEDVLPRIVEFAEQAWPVVRAFVDDAAIAFDQLRDRVTDALTAFKTDVIDEATVAFERVAVAARAAFEWVRDHWTEIYTVMSAALPILVAGVTAYKAYAGITAAITALKLFTLGVHASTMALLANPVVLVVAGIAALAAALFVAYQRIEWFRNAVDAVAGAVKRWVGGLVDAFRDGGIVGALSFVWDSIVTVFTNVQGWLTGTALPAIAGFLGGLAEKLGGWVVAGASYLLENLPIWLGSLVSWFVGDVIPAAAYWLGRLIGEFGAWVVDAAGDLLANLPVWLGTLGNWLITTAIPSLVRTTARVQAAFVQWLIDVIPTIPGRVWAIFTKVSEAVYDAIPAIAGWLFDVGVAFTRGLLDGATSLGRELQELPMKLVGGVVSGVKALLGINSPSRVMMDIGRQTMEGFRLGVVRNGVDIGDAIGIPSVPALATVGAGTANGAGGMNVTVNATTNADPYRIGSELAWIMRTSGR